MLIHIMSQFTHFRNITLFTFLLILTIFLWGCNSQDDIQKTTPTTQDSTSAKVTPPIKPPRPEDWHMFMNDLQFSGKSPEQDLKPPLQLLWKFKTGGPLSASPVIANGILYIGSADGKMYALDAKKWDIKWVYNAGSSIRFSAVVWGGQVYFNTRNNKFYALDADSGELVWDFKSQGWMDSPPVVFEGIVYTGAYPSRIYMLDAFTGKLKSERQRKVTINGVEYGCSNGEFRPVFPQHNTKLWRSYTEASESFPVSANGYVYIGARDGKIHAINLSNKTETWSYLVDGPVDAAPAIADGVLYTSSTDGYIYAFTNAVEGTSVTKDTRKYGIVARDNAPVYKEKDGTSHVYVLNDGTHLPILQTERNRYQVELPNKEDVWIDKLSFGEFVEIDGVSFNIQYCGNPQTIHLINGAEYPYWSPDGKRVAMLKRTDLSGSYWKATELWIMGRDGRQAKKLYSGQFYNPHVSWSLDSRLIALEVEVDGDQYVYIVDWELGKIKRLVRGTAPTWSPAANQLAFKRREKGYDYVYRINSDGSGGREIAKVQYKQSRYAYSYIHAPSWSPDGKTLAFEVSYDHKVGNGTVPYAAIRIQNVEGERIKQIPTQHQRVRQVRWSPNGKRLAYVVSGSNRQDPVLDKRLHITSVNDDTIKHQIHKHTTPAWSPTGNLLAYLEKEDCAGIQWKVWIYDLENGRKYPIARTSMNVASIVWMPDGKNLCIWHTSDYLQDNVYKPADTKGWIVPINLSM